VRRESRLPVRVLHKRGKGLCDSDTASVKSFTLRDRACRSRRRTAIRWHSVLHVTRTRSARWTLGRVPECRMQSSHLYMSQKHVGCYYLCTIHSES